MLDDAGRTGTGQSSAEVLGVPGAVLAEKLTGHLVREIMLRGSGGGPLTPLADQLNHDLTHLQGQRVEGMLARLVALGITAPAPSADAGGPARDVGRTSGWGGAGQRGRSAAAGRACGDQRAGGAR